MSADVVAFVITLEPALHEDGVEDTVRALRHIRGVTDVQPVKSDLTLLMARMAVDTEWRNRLIAVLKEARR